MTPSSYQTTERLFATRYKQGARTVYGMALTPDQLTTLVSRPDPAIATPGNRRIRAAHAAGFARYFIENEHWVIPGIILRAPGIFSFEPLEGTGEMPDVDFGFMAYSKRNVGDIHILDGQHRILGFFAALEMLSEKLDKARSKKAAARRVQDGNAVAAMDREIAELERARDRFYTERVSVEIKVTDDLREARQMFFDIADNALGITQSVKARFDSTKAINRALPGILEHPLLAGHVDIDNDRVQRNSPFLMSARHVVETTRVLTVGFDGRIGRRMESELDENVIGRNVDEFLTMLTQVFPPLAAYQNNTITAATLRDTMLIGNPLFIRILAGVQWALVNDHSWTKARVKEYFTKLAPHTYTRAHDNSIWQVYAPETAFAPNAAGPNGRRSDSVLLVEAMTQWALDREDFVSAEPMPAPAEPTPDPDDELDFAFDHSTKELGVEVREEIADIAAESIERSKRGGKA